jgi:hypothetical protein
MDMDMDSVGMGTIAGDARKKSLPSTKIEDDRILTTLSTAVLPRLLPTLITITRPSARTSIIRT